MPPSDATLLRASDHLARGELDRADSIVRLALKRKPNDAHASFLAAAIATRRGAFESALHHARRAVAAAPDMASCRDVLAGALFFTGDRAGAVDAYGEAARLAPANPDYPCNQGEVLQVMGRYDDAEAAFSRARDTDPAAARPIVSLAILQLVTGRAADALDTLRAAPPAAASDPRLQSALCTTLNYVDGVAPAQIAEAHRAYGRLFPAPPRPARTHRAGAPLRLAYISPDLRAHSVAYFLEPLLRHHDSAKLHITCYSTATRHDATSERLRTLSDLWREVGALDEPSLADQIRRDGVDMLIDLAGHTSGGRLPVLALRPAPIQGTYLGYPNTTGLAAIDFRIVDSVTDPPGDADVLATERLLRIDPCFLCYSPPPGAPDPAPSRRAPGSPPTFGSFNAIAKITPAVIDAWASILQAAPGSRLLIKSQPLATDSVRRRLLDAFAARSIGPDRIEPLAFTETLADHLGLYARIDVALDTFPYNGTTTTCEALWMGVPVVTLAGATHAGRVGASLLAAAGLGDLVTRSPSDYARAALTLAADPDALVSYRRNLRGTLAASPLLDAAAFTGRFEAALLEAARAVGSPGA